MMVWQYNHPNADMKAAPELPPDMPPDMPVKRFFAKTYRWPPWMVGELSLEELEWFPLYETAVGDAQEAIQEIQERRNER